MKRVIIAGVIVGTLLFLWSLSSDAAEIQGFYAKVEKGDCLTSISKQVYGTIDKWTIIRDLNNLKKPYTVHVGQVLRVSDLSPAQRNELAFRVVWNYMEAHFKARRGQVFGEYINRHKVYEEFRLLMTSPEQLPTYEARNLLNRTITKLEWVDLLEIADSIKANVETPWHTLLMAALGAQESGFRNVPGSHGEIGPYQIKPSTAVWLLSDDVPIKNEDEAVSVLELPFNNTWMSYRILQKRGLTESEESLIPALENYNAGRDKVKYARQVEKRFERLLERYHEAVAEALKQPSLSPVP